MASPEQSPTGSTSDGREVIIRRHPLSRQLPLSLDLSNIGIHCLLRRLNGPITSYFKLISFLGLLEQLTSPTAVSREVEIIRVAYDNARFVGPVYDLPTVPGWALWQKIARIDSNLSGLLGSSRSVYRVPKGLLKFDDIRPDKDALPEVSPYTQLASILYEALDSLLLDNYPTSDPHLRNLYPHSVWTSGNVYSLGQARRLAAIASPPRVFSRWLESPITGEILAVRGVVRRDGWLTLFQALAPSYVEGGFSFADRGLERFVPRSLMDQKPVATSLLIDQLTFAELYYLIMIEEVASDGDVQAVLHLQNGSVCGSLGLVDHFLDRPAFCKSRGVRIEENIELTFGPLDSLAKSANEACLVLAFAEQAMCDKLCDEDMPEAVLDDLGATFIYKKDARIDFPLMDGYDGWSDEELSQKKFKAWARYTPQALLPVEVHAYLVERGLQFYCVDGGMTILRTNFAEWDHYKMSPHDIFVRDNVSWTELRPFLEEHGQGLRNAADRLLLSLLSGGLIRLSGYFHCADIAEGRHACRSLGVFMDAPLRVLGCRVTEKTFSTTENDYLVIPVGPAYTLVMRDITEKTSKLYGVVYHSERVIALPFGCRLGDRSHLRWYQVGAGPWQSSKHPPQTLIEVVEKVTSKLSCTAAGERDHIMINAHKGLTSVRLRDIGFEAGWTGWSPHLIITGKGKRINASVRAHSMTHVVEILRRMRDRNQIELDVSIQEIGSMIVLKEVLIGALNVTGNPQCLNWSPAWKRADQGFAIAHSICLPRGIGVRLDGIDTTDDSDENVGFLISRDTMAIFRHCGEVSGVWRLLFLGLDANIESEKLLVGPDYEYFLYQVCAGRMGVS